MFIRSKLSRTKCLAGLVLVCFLCLMIFGIAFVTESNLFGIRPSDVSSNSADDVRPSVKPTLTKVQMTETGKTWESSPNKETARENEKKYPSPNYNVHVFYYPWFGSPAVDGKYLHWNHHYLQHWNAKEAAKWPKGQHQPPDDIGSNFYPSLGPYSSKDPAVLESHMQQIRSTGAGVLSVSWYPPGTADDEGEELDAVLPMILNYADKYNLKVCLHIEPYKNRNYKNMKDNIKYIIEKYGDHNAFYRRIHASGRSLPLFYVYDSYLVSDEEWKKILMPDGEHTLRNTNIDGIFVGLLVEKRHASSLVLSGFDGFYTYFASDGFTFGSNTGNWNFLSQFAKEHNVLFIPSVGPGYIDERIRPWNGANTKDRRNGEYYERSFQLAVNTLPSAISITSFNEWHEGTQIEEAVPKASVDFKYLDYLPYDPQYYLLLTRKWVFKFTHRQNLISSKITPPLSK